MRTSPDQGEPTSCYDRDNGFDNNAKPMGEDSVE